MSFCNTVRLNFLIPLFIFYIIYRYLTMKNTKTPTEKPVPKTEDPIETAVSKAKNTKPSPAQKAPKKAQAETAKPEASAKIEQPAAPVITEEKLKTPSPTKSPARKSEVVAPKSEPVALTPELPMAERVGLTAGSIWHYLSKNGTTPVAKLVKELPEEEKIIQRSIGWLAQESKISIDILDRVETISLIG
jgi:predicted DNA-binding transcriptional regulator AlpA